MEAVEANEVSTDPYKKNNKGLRIRQHYHRAVTRMSKRYMAAGPHPAATGYEAYKIWCYERVCALRANRDELLIEAEQRERSQRNARKRDHGKRRPRGS